jgi:hypothetical protein
VEEFVQQCSVCQQAKVERIYPAGLLQPLPIPERAWTDITMDFIAGLPKSEGYNLLAFRTTMNSDPRDHEPGCAQEQQTGTTLGDLDWFGPPERKTLHPVWGASPEYVFLRLDGLESEMGVLQ